MSPLEVRIRSALDQFQQRRYRIVIILETLGGIVEVAERIVNTIRSLYKEVYFIVPNQAMSAGTVLALSGDKIFMDDFSCLGPIDPQIQRLDGTIVPALS